METNEVKSHVTTIDLSQSPFYWYGTQITKFELQEYPIYPPQRYLLGSIL